MVYGLPSEADKKKCLNRTENSSVRFFYFDPIIILFSAYSPKNGRKPDKLHAFLLSDDLFHSYFCCRQNLEIQPLSIFSKNITDCPIEKVSDIFITTVQDRPCGRLSSGHMARNNPF